MRRAGIMILLLLVVFAFVFGGTGSIDTMQRLLPPSFAEPFGTDTLGRSLLERVAGGLGISLAVASVTSLFSIILGIVLSFLYTLPRFPKEILLSVSDSMKAVPSIVLALFLASISGPGFIKLSIAISLSHIADVSRTSYSRTSFLMNEGFVDAEKCIGAKNSRIFFRVILPHVMPYLTFQGVSIFLSAVITESTLSYLGCGIAAPLPSLGSILAESRPVILSSPWMVLFPALFLLLLGISLELIALSFSEPDTAFERSHKSKFVSVSEVSSDRQS